MNIVNTAINKKKYAKVDDVKHLSKIVIPEAVRADTTKSFASQSDVFAATLCILHGPVARSVVSFPSQPCWSHDFSVEDSMAYMKMYADISAELSLAYGADPDLQRLVSTRDPEEDVYSDLITYRYKLRNGTIKSHRLHDAPRPGCLEATTPCPSRSTMMFTCILIGVLDCVMIMRGFLLI